MGYLTNCRTGSALSTCESCKKPTAPQTQKLKVFKLEELEVATNSFSPKNVLGKGSHACVYKAVLSDGQVVAVKRPTIGRRNLQDVTSFDNELEILSTLHHRHLVNLIGFCNESSEKLLVVEFMGRGTLFDLLHSSKEPLSWPLRVHMALQAAKAILALHLASPPIIHRDVKSSNVLVDSNWDAKLGDLGLALRGQLEDVVRQRAPPAGTMGYIDPEYETPSQLSSKSDVFSFGILLLEIMSGRNAIDVRFNPSSIVDWAVPLITKGKSLALCDPALKPPQNTKAVRQLAAIAARSVRLSSDRRPTMAEVVEGLRQIRRKLPIPPVSGTLVMRNTISSAAGIKGEILEDFSDGASSSKSESLSIFDEGSVVGEGNVSPADSVLSNQSQTSIRRRSSITDCNFDDDVVAATRHGSPAAGLGTRKSEQPIFDPKSSSRMSNYQTRIDMVCNSAGCPVSMVSSPGWSVNNCLTDWSTRRRSLESPTFGSEIPVRKMDLRTPASAPGLSAQHTTNRLNGNEENALQPSIYPQGSSILTISMESSTGEAILASSNDLSEDSNSQLSTTEANEDVSSDTALSAASKPVHENSVIAHASRGLGPADGDARPDLSDISSLQATVSLTKDFSPIWGTTTTAMKFYAESHFEKGLGLEYPKPAIVCTNGRCKWIG